MHGSIDVSVPISNSSHPHLVPFVINMSVLSFCVCVSALQIAFGCSVFSIGVRVNVILFFASLVMN